MKDFFILDVGHGNSAVLIDEDGVVVIDTGRSATLLHFLKSRKIKVIDVLIISHADFDHVGGLVGILSAQEVIIKKIYLNPDASKKTAVWDDMLIELNSLRRKGMSPELNTQLTCNTKDLSRGKITVEVLAPSPEIAAKGSGSKDLKGRRLSSNSMSAVIRLSHNSFPVCLLPGDLDMIGLNNLLEENKKIEAKVLIFPHHGGRSGSDLNEFSELLMKQVKPEMTIFSIGHNKHSNPQPEIVKRMKHLNSKMRFACTQMSTQCSFRKEVPDFKHLLEVTAEGRDDNKCCAGSLNIRSTGSSYEVFPKNDDHQAFISSSADKPLCRQ